jgi:predicted esterase
MSENELGFNHRFVPGERTGEEDSGPVLLLLHGTGGDENDLLPLGRELMPGASLLSPRGKILEGGMPRFFRRLAEGVFDEEDLVERTHELAGFVESASRHYGFDAGKVWAVGFSNGANIAASLLMLRSNLMAGAVLLRAMVPFEPESAPDLTGKPVYLAAGRSDPIIPPENSDRLAELLRSAGAEVALDWQPGGHGIRPVEVASAKSWLGEKAAATEAG